MVKQPFPFLIFLASGIIPGHKYILKFLFSCLSDTHPENPVNPVKKFPFLTLSVKHTCYSTDNTVRVCRKQGIPAVFQEQWMNWGIKALCD